MAKPISEERFCDGFRFRSTHPTKQRPASIAGAIVELGDLGGAAVAIVAIGAPVAAADRPVLADAHLRRARAGAVNVRGVAEPDPVVAEQPLAACEANDGTANRPFVNAAPWRLFSAARFGPNGRRCRNGKSSKEGENGTHDGTPVSARIVAWMRGSDIRVHARGIGRVMQPALSGAVMDSTSISPLRHS